MPTTRRAATAKLTPLEQWRMAFTSRPAGKFGASPTTYRGERYASKAEARYAATLDLRVAAGDLAGWRRGRAWLLQEGGRRVRITYTPDFECWRRAPSPAPEGDLWVVDVKGGPTDTPSFRVKARLFLARYPTVPFVVARAISAGRSRRGRADPTWEETTL